MLGYIKGILTYVNEDSVILDNHGIGYLIKTTRTFLERAPKSGSEITLFVYMYVREDEVSLYGFLKTEELEVFKMLIGISGVGPRAAISVLSTLSVDELSMAVLSNDAKAISKANGIGAKGANRIIIDLKDKLKLEDMRGYREDGEMSDGSQDGLGEVAMALVSLGYSNLEAMRAVRAVENYEDLDTQALLKAALKKMV